MCRILNQKVIGESTPSTEAARLKKKQVWTDSLMSLIPGFLFLNYPSIFHLFIYIFGLSVLITLSVATRLEKVYGRSELFFFAIAISIFFKSTI